MTRQLAAGSFIISKFSFSEISTSSVRFYWSQFASKNYALSVQGFSIIILQRSHSDSLRFNGNDFHSFVKQPLDFQSIVVEFDSSIRWRSCNELFCEIIRPDIFPCSIARKVSSPEKSTHDLEKSRSYGGRKRKEPSCI